MILICPKCGHHTYRCDGCNGEMIDAPLMPGHKLCPNHGGDANHPGTKLYAAVVNMRATIELCGPCGLKQISIGAKAAPPTKAEAEQQHIAALDGAGNRGERPAPGARKESRKP
jgi:hypothetical protein